MCEIQKSSAKADTLPETDIAPENGWLEYYFPFRKGPFQGELLNFQGLTLELLSAYFFSGGVDAI